MQQVKIKDMGGLAILKQHKVGAVHQVVARNLTNGAQASLQPLGAGANLDIANDASGVARTCSGIVVTHCNVLGGSAASCLGDAFRSFQCATAHGANLARQSKMAETVAAV